MYSQVGYSKDGRVENKEDSIRILYFSKSFVEDIYYFICLY